MVGGDWPLVQRACFEVSNASPGPCPVRRRHSNGAFYPVAFTQVLRLREVVDRFLRNWLVNGLGTIPAWGTRAKGNEKEGCHSHHWLDPVRPGRGYRCQVPYARSRPRRLCHHGIVGGIVGGFLGRAMGWYRDGDAVGFFMADIGAVIVLAVYRSTARDTNRCCDRGARYYALTVRPIVNRESLGLPAVLPPPEEEKDVKTAIGAARAKKARREML
jgi:hypothetical protein